MNNYLLILAVVAVVALGGLTVLFIDSGTGLVIAQPTTPAQPEINICNKILTEINAAVSLFSQNNCGKYYTLKKLVCNPAGHMFIPPVTPLVPDAETAAEFKNEEKCTGIASTIDIWTKKLELKSINIQACKNILKALRDKYKCAELSPRAS